MEGYILWAVPTSADAPILYGRIRSIAEELPKGVDRYIARGCGIGAGTHKPARCGHMGSWSLLLPRVASLSRRLGLVSSGLYAILKRHRAEARSSYPRRRHKSRPIARIHCPITCVAVPFDRHRTSSLRLWGRAANPAPR